MAHLPLLSVPIEIRLNIYEHMPMAAEKKVLICLWENPLALTSPPPYTSGLQQPPNPNSAMIIPTLVGGQRARRSVPVRTDHERDQADFETRVRNNWMVAHSIGDVNRERGSTESGPAYYQRESPRQPLFAKALNIFLVNKAIGGEVREVFLKRHVFRFGTPQVAPLLGTPNIFNTIQYLEIEDTWGELPGQWHFENQLRILNSATNIKEIKLGKTALSGKTMMDFLAFAGFEGEPETEGDPRTIRRIGLNQIVEQSPLILEEQADLVCRLDHRFHVTKCAYMTIPTLPKVKVCDFQKASQLLRWEKGCTKWRGDACSLYEKHALESFSACVAELRTAGAYFGTKAQRRDLYGRQVATLSNDIRLDDWLRSVHRELGQEWGGWWNLVVSPVEIMRAYDNMERFLDLAMIPGPPLGPDSAAMLLELVKAQMAIDKQGIGNQDLWQEPAVSSMLDIAKLTQKGVCSPLCDQCRRYVTEVRGEMGLKLRTEGRAGLERYQITWFGETVRFW